ncbi:MAG: hypothetical protein ABIC04_00720 [Nanoarchaeota archaeon]
MRWREAIRAKHLLTRVGDTICTVAEMQQTDDSITQAIGYNVAVLGWVAASLEKKYAPKWAKDNTGHSTDPLADLIADYTTIQQQASNSGSPENAFALLKKI